MKQLVAAIGGPSVTLAVSLCDSSPYLQQQRGHGVQTGLEAAEQWRAGLLPPGADWHDANSLLLTLHLPTRLKRFVLSIETKCAN